MKKPWKLEARLIDAANHDKAMERLRRWRGRSYGTLEALERAIETNSIGATWGICDDVLLVAVHCHKGMQQPVYSYPRNTVKAWKDRVYVATDRNF